MRFRFRIRVRVKGLRIGPWAPGPSGLTVKFIRLRADTTHDI